jgi:Ca2+-binding RTX toxin-like protein
MYMPSVTPDQFHLGASAADASDRFIYNSTTAGLFFDGDGIGAIAQVHLLPYPLDFP